MSAAAAPHLFTMTSLFALRYNPSLIYAMTHLISIEVQPDGVHWHLGLVAEVDDAVLARSDTAHAGLHMKVQHFFIN